MAVEFTARDVAEARRALAKCDEYVQEAEKAKACGIDCTEPDEIHKWTRNYLQNWLEIYGNQFPVRRT